jgi:kynurenine formamidase
MTVRSFIVVGFLSALVATADQPARAVPPPAASITLGEAYDAIHAANVVDLTHKFGPDTPHLSGLKPETVTELYSIAKAGFRVDYYCHVGQWGTHVDAPAHFHAGLKAVDQIDPKEFLLKLVVLDVHEKVVKNPDYVVSLDDVRAWEAAHGPIPTGAFVALRTDWSKRWPDEAAMENRDAKGVAHYPGWSREVLQFLYETRKITASGHETTDTDPGSATTHDDYALESYLLGLNHFQIELLTNLDKIPVSGGLIMVSFPNALDATGFPARIVAIVPKDPA